ncbi:hypothetical protein FQN57_006233 [Myotisia sp. PD_48]|nr:hypothetical protein FQN57_006233 [Myotisia sp. PD_48]
MSHMGGNPNMRAGNDGDLHPIPYTPISSLARELGIMFGFLASCIGTMVIYWYFWQVSQRRNAVKEAARRELFVERARAAAAAEAAALAEKDKVNIRGRSIGANSSDNNASASGEGSRRPHRTGTGAIGLEFGDREEDMVV